MAEDMQKQDDLAIDERLVNAEEAQAAPIKLDYTLESPVDRNELVKKIISETPSEKLTPSYLGILTDYIIFAMDKEERKQKKILTDNHMVTVNRRETSYEGLVSKLENGENGIYNMIANDKNIIFTPKVSITQEDIDTMPELKELRQAIDEVEKMQKKAVGKKKYLLKKQLIEMRQDQYVIKGSYKQPIYCINGIKSFAKLDLSENITVIPVPDKEAEIKSDCLIDMFNPKHISLLLLNYSKLKEETYSKFTSDAYYMMNDLDNLVDNALKEDYPMYFDIIVYKIDNKTNEEIQDILYKDYGIKHSVEYISSLWRNKIPKMLAKYAEDEYITWHYTFKEYGKWKRCSRCGEYKVADNRFFSKNKTSKDGFYSICKKCRNKKKEQVKLIEPPQDKNS